MIFPRLFNSRFAALALVFFAAIFSAEAQRISKIVIENIGPPAASESLVRSNIRSKEGEEYNRMTLDQDIKNLYGTGFFYNVRAAGQQGPQGFVITFVLEGKPRLTDIKFSGNKKYSNNRLKKKIKSKTGEPLSEQKLFSDAQAIQEMYEKAGYQKTTVRYETSIDEAAGTGTATFIVRESPKIKIKDIQFENAKAFKQRELRKVLKTKRHWMFSFLTGSGVLKEEEFEDDKDRLAEHYQNAGYIDFAIKDIKTNFLTPNKIVLTFNLYEGPQYRVGSVGFKGNTIFTTNDFINGIALEPAATNRPGSRFVRLLTPTRAKALAHIRMVTGTIFRPVGDAKYPGLQTDLEMIRDIYGSRGYVNVERGGGTKIVARQIPNVATGTMDLVYDIEEGDKLYIEKIEIKGNTKTKDNVIRRELAVSPGEVYDMVRVKLSEQRLKNLDFFEKVDSQPEDTDVGPSHKNLVIGVDEKNTGNLVVGAGFSSVDSIVGFAEVSEGNFDLFHPPTFRGGGQKMRLRVQLGTVRQDYELTFIEPWLFGKKLSLGVTLFHRDLGFVSLNDQYDEIHSGGTVSLTKALGSDFLIGKASYTLDQVDLKLNSGFYTNAFLNPVPNPSAPGGYSFVTSPPNISPAIYNERGNRLISKVGFSLAYDTVNSTLLPNKGQHTEILTEVAGGPFGGDTDFYKLELRTAWFFKGFRPGHVIEIDGGIGVAKSYQGRDVPIFERYFLGGLESLRGYRYREVGPMDQYGEPLGGDTSWHATAEYSIPIIERVRIAAFYDIGNVYAQPFSFNPGTSAVTDFTAPGFVRNINRGLYSDDWGIGLRLDLPIGPLRLDYGIPISHDPNVSGSGRFQFGVGYRHNF